MKCTKVIASDLQSLRPARLTVYRHICMYEGMQYVCVHVVGALWRKRLAK